MKKPRISQGAFSSHLLELREAFVRWREPGGFVADSGKIAYEDVDLVLLDAAGVHLQSGTRIVSIPLKKPEDHEVVRQLVDRVRAAQGRG